MLATFLQRLTGATPPEPAQLQLGDEILPVIVRRNARARRYVLRLTGEGTIRVTVPRGGSVREAMAFVQRQTAWIARQRDKLRQGAAREWHHGSEVFFRGEPHVLRRDDASGEWHFADQRLWVSPETTVRAAVETHLWNLATRELPPRVVELAQAHSVSIRRVTVRNQRSRWGSCSVRGTVSLNWRLVQTPPLVSDYIILHELMHTRQMNHSVRFWREVAAVCPQWREAERWLRKHSRLIRG